MDAQSYPGKGLSLSQLIFALNEELKRTAHSTPYVEEILDTLKNARNADFSYSFTLEVISQLDKDTSTALATIREWKNSFVHINRIPLDVLSLIPTYLPSQGDRLRASFVCRHWRRVFLQRAELWSQLFLSEGEVYLKTLLGRVKGTALDVISTYRVPVSTMALLSSHTKQIRYLQFTYNEWMDIQAFSQISSGPLPLLHTLAITTFMEYGLSRFDRPPSSPLLFSSAVNLEVFRLHSNSDRPPFLSQFAFPNIVSFEFTARLSRGFRALQLLDFLEGSTMLRTIFIRIHSNISVEGIPQDKLILLPKVETFELIVSEGGPGYKIATCISCPSARHTSLRHEKYDYETIPEEMFPSSAAWNAIVRQYTSNPVEEVALEIRLASVISCNLTFRSPNTAGINLCFRASTDDEEEDPIELELRSAEIHHEGFTQATRTIRNYPHLANVKRLRIYHSCSYNLAISIPRIANEVGRLFKTLGPLDELTLDRCDLQSYFHSPLNLLENFIEEPVIFPPIRMLTVSHPMCCSDGQFTTAILGLAKSQHARGTPFECVRIYSESMPVGMEEGLRPLVGSMEYFYDEMSETDDD